MAFAMATTGHGTTTTSRRSEKTKLHEKLRRTDFTGLELVRRDDDERRVPLWETDLFRDEVPFRGRPLDAASPFVPSSAPRRMFTALTPGPAGPARGVGDVPA